GRERRAARRENAWMFRQAIIGTYVLYEHTFSCQATRALQNSTDAAATGTINETMRNGGPEFQGVARNHPTRGSVPSATINACRLDRSAAAKSAAAPRSVNSPSPIEIPVSPSETTASRKHEMAKTAYTSPAATSRVARRFTRPVLAAGLATREPAEKLGE